MPGGAYAYRKGRASEYAVRDALRAHGWYVTRAYASKGPWDLLAMRPASRGATVLMVQVKTGKPYAVPGERNKLRRMADQAGAHPIIAGYVGAGRGHSGSGTCTFMWLQRDGSSEELALFLDSESPQTPPPTDLGHRDIQT